MICFRFGLEGLGILKDPVIQGVELSFDGCRSRGLKIWGLEVWDI